MKKLVGNIVFILMVVGFVVGIHAGIKYGKPNYIHWVFKSNAKELERISFNELADFKAKVINQMKEDGVPVNYEKINQSTKFYQDREGVKHAEIFWTVHVDYYGFFPKDFHFKVEVTR
jgi:hypothetical protein